MYILVVDDNTYDNTIIRFVLNKEGYEVETTDSPRRAMQLIQKREPDLLLLDVAMPYLNGFDFLAKLRAEGYNTPVIFISAQDSIEAKLRGLQMGAEDYICKPYNHQELVTRIPIVMRRINNHSATSHQSIRVGRIELFPTSKVTIDGQEPIALTHTEMHILRILMSYPGQVVKRHQLMTEIWNDAEGDSNVLDVYICRLRAKLGMGMDRSRYIVSVRGTGYKFFGK